MDEYVATFFTHYDALLFQRHAEALGVSGQLAPVPGNSALPAVRACCFPLPGGSGGSWLPAAVLSSWPGRRGRDISCSRIIGNGCSCKQADALRPPAFVYGKGLVFLENHIAKRAAFLYNKRIAFLYNKHIYAKNTFPFSGAYY